jgi:clan AA aspartic protease (TIGR02281 family)
MQANGKTSRGDFSFKDTDVSLNVDRFKFFIRNFSKWPTLRRRPLNILWGVLLAGFCIAAVGVRGQEYYRWVDEKGVIHFSDNLGSIPEKNRGDVQEERFPTSSESPGQTPQEQPGDKATVPSELIVVPFDRMGNHIVVQGIVNNNEQIAVDFILDTGASLTIIPAEMAHELRIDPAKGDPFPLKTAGGWILVPLVEISSLKVSAAEVKNLQIAIHDLGGKGLLGMDFLSNFRVDMDYARNRLALERQPGSHGGQSLLWWQRKFRFYHKLKRTIESYRANARNRRERERADSHLRAVQDRINDIEIRASRAAVPRELRR